MSGTLNEIYNNISYALNQHMAAMAKLQEQTSTGSLVNRVSDNPSVAYEMLSLGSQKSSLENYLKNLADVSNVLTESNTAIDSIKIAFSQATKAVNQITSGTYNESMWATTAAQMDDILEQVVSLANTQYMNQYLFGGSSSGEAPYTVERTDGKIQAVNYQGSSVSREVEVAAGVRSESFIAGDDIFRLNDRQEPVFSGVTGAAAGTGTSTVRGDVWLKVISEGGSYKVSIDDGATYTTVPAGGEDNQAVTDSRTGQILYVNTKGINSTGVELVRVPGTSDIFSTLITIRDVFLNEKGLSASQASQLRDSMLKDLDEQSNLMLQTMTKTGSKISFLESLKENMTQMKNNAEDQMSSIGDADIAQIAIDLSRRQLLYQMSLSAAAKMMSVSLLDYLQ